MSSWNNRISGSSSVPDWFNSLQSNSSSSSSFSSSSEAINEEHEHIPQISGSSSVPDWFNSLQSNSSSSSSFSSSSEAINEEHEHIPQNRYREEPLPEGGSLGWKVPTTPLPMAQSAEYLFMEVKVPNPKEPLLAPFPRQHSQNFPPNASSSNSEPHSMQRDPFGEEVPTSVIVESLRASAVGFASASCSSSASSGHSLSSSPDPMPEVHASMTAFRAWVDAIAAAGMQRLEPSSAESAATQSSSRVPPSLVMEPDLLRPQSANPGSSVSSSRSTQQSSARNHSTRDQRSLETMRTTMASRSNTVLPALGEQRSILRANQSSISLGAPLSISRIPASSSSSTAAAMPSEFSPMVHLQGREFERINLAIQQLCVQQGPISEERTDEAANAFADYIQISSTLNAVQQLFAQRALRIWNPNFDAMCSHQIFLEGGLRLSGKQLMARLWMFANGLNLEEAVNTKNRMILALANFHNRRLGDNKNHNNQQLILSILEACLGPIRVGPPFLQSSQASTSVPASSSSSSDIRASSNAMESNDESILEARHLAALETELENAKRECDGYETEGRSANVPGNPNLVLIQGLSGEESVEGKLVETVGRAARDDQGAVIPNRVITNDNIVHDGEVLVYPPSHALAGEPWLDSQRRTRIRLFDRVFVWGARQKREAAMKAAALARYEAGMNAGALAQPDQLQALNQAREEARQKYEALRERIGRLVTQLARVR